jgi:hypothetical protein
VANTDNPFGFLPVAQLGGGDEVYRIYTHALADTTAIGIGDLVDITGAADTVTQAAGGGPFLGSAHAYVAASTLSTDVPVHIANPRSVYVAQEDSDTSILAAADEGENATVIVAAVNTTSGRSQMEIDSDTVTVTATFDLRLLEPAPYVDNTVASSNAKWFVLINDLRFGDLKAGV